MFAHRGPRVIPIPPAGPCWWEVGDGSSAGAPFLLGRSGRGDPAVMWSHRVRGRGTRCHPAEELGHFPTLAFVLVWAPSCSFPGGCGPKAPVDAPSPAHALALAVGVRGHERLLQPRNTAGWGREAEGGCVLPGSFPLWSPLSPSPRCPSRPSEQAVGTGRSTSPRFARKGRALRLFSLLLLFLTTVS